MEFTATTTITDDMAWLPADDAITMPVPVVVRMTHRKVSGFCGLCGTVKIVPAHPVTELAPPGVAACGCA